MGLEERVQAKLGSVMELGGASLPLTRLVTPSGETEGANVARLAALIDALREIAVDTAREVDDLTNRLDELS
jgi:hypothetical protein